MNPREDALDDIPPQSLARYVEELAEMLIRANETEVDELMPESGVGPLMGELWAVRRLSLDDTKEIATWAERLASNRRKDQRK